jgi:hypothetical protein
MAALWTNWDERNKCRTKTANELTNITVKIPHRMAELSLPKRYKNTGLVYNNLKKEVCDGKVHDSRMG